MVANLPEGTIICLTLLLLFFKYVEDNLGVMSVGFLLASPSDAVIWRGPKKNGKNLTNLNGKEVFKWR